MTTNRFFARPSASPRHSLRSRLIPLSSLLRRDVPEAAQRYAEHVNPAFVRLLGVLGYGRDIVRASGNALWDREGRRYTDFLAGFGTNALGHNPPRLLEALRRALAEDLPNVLHTAPQSAAAELGAELARAVPSLPMCLPSLSGGEAVEAAMKLARAATGRPAIVYASGGFHGTGLGGLSVMGHARWKKPFQPLVPECHAVPFGDLDSLRHALRRHDVAAFVVEPIQGEAGVVEPPPGYLAEAQRACRDAGALFVLDEVQTGMGRTGALLSFQREQLDPDVVVLGKALGGGVLPVSATLARRELHDRAYGSMFDFDLHGSTYAGYALGCRVAVEMLRAIQEQDLCEAARRRGSSLRELLAKRVAGHPIVQGVRGEGLLVGLVLGPNGDGPLDRLAPLVKDTIARQVLGQWLAVRLLERGFLCQPASQAWNVLKLTPPLTITDDEIAGLVSAIGDVLDEYRDIGPLLADVGARVVRQIANRGRFG